MKSLTSTSEGDILSEIKETYSEFNWRKEHIGGRKV